LQDLRIAAAGSRPPEAKVPAHPHRTGATELRALAGYVEALGGRPEIIADFRDERLAFTEPGSEAAWRSTA